MNEAHERLLQRIKDVTESKSGKWSMSYEVRERKRDKSYGPWIMVPTFIVTDCQWDTDAWIKASQIINPLADPKISVRCVNWEAVD